MAYGPTPLSTYQKLHTRDVSVARATISRALGPHTLTLLDDNFEVTHNIAPFGEMSVHYIDYSGEVELSIPTTTLYIVQVPTMGHSVIRAANRTLTIHTGTAIMTSPGYAMQMRFSAQNPRLMVQIPAPLFQSRLALAREAGLQIDTNAATKLDLTRGRGRSWRMLLSILIADLERHEGFATAPFASTSMQSTLIDGLLTAMAEHTTSTDVPGPLREHTIQRAARLIEDHCAEPLTSHDIAEAVGMSVRSLQSGFRDHLGTTPMSLLRQHRLRHVREALVSGTAHSVTEAALRAGVTHLGRLSSEYAAAYGESPSQTIKRLK